MRCRKLHWAVAVLLLSGLAAAQQSGYWLDVPFVRQSREGCGAASIAMIMQYWAAQSGNPPGRSSDSSYILSQLHSPVGHGIYASAMEAYLREHGFQVFPFRGTWSDLSHHLQKGRPLIVALQPVSGSQALHYVAVAGVDLQRELVMFNDPAGRKLSKLDRKTFEKQWNATDRWTLLALPQSGKR